MTIAGHVTLSILNHGRTHNMPLKLQSLKIETKCKVASARNAC